MTRPGEKVVLVAVVGGSGAGKSVLAQALCEEFGSLAARVSLDDFYRDLSHLSLAQRTRVNFDHPRAIDWETVGQTLARMSNSERLELPVYDFAIHSRLPRTRQWAPRPLVFWEGLWLLYRRDLRKYFSYSIYVECPSEERVSRRIRRDVAERARTVQSVKDQFERHVEPMHQLHVVPQKRHAASCVTSPVSPEEFRAVVSALRGLL